GMPARATETTTDIIVNEARLYRRIVGARIRSDWQFRGSFVTYLVAQIVVITFEVIALVILISLVPRFGGWTKPQILFLYGLATLPFAIGDVFISEVERLADKYIRPGEFDTVLLRPSSALLQILALEFEFRRSGKLLPPTAALIWAVPNLGVSWTGGRVAALVGAVACGTVIYASLWVVAASITFWAVASREATHALTYGSQFANQYPLHVYPGYIRAVMGWALPLAFVAYIPAVFTAETANPLGLPPWFAFSPPAVAALMIVVAHRAWTTGVRHYQSTGS
ncbi:MAG: ABC-2 family transporter protein, partial [Acidimicrobiia bacterium]|nr:ABC-2 family transporter protein [Acidimicrobiia bacterium]